MERGLVSTYPKWRNPKKNKMELYFHTYYKHIETSKEKKTEKIGIISLLKRKTRMTTQHTIFFQNSSKWKQDANNTLFLFVWEEEYLRSKHNVNTWNSIRPINSSTVHN